MNKETHEEKLWNAGGQAGDFEWMLSEPECLNQALDSLDEYVRYHPERSALEIILHVFESKAEALLKSGEHPHAVEVIKSGSKVRKAVQDANPEKAAIEMMRFIMFAGNCQIGRFLEKGLILAKAPNKGGDKSSRRPWSVWLACHWFIDSNQYWDKSTPFIWRQFVKALKKNSINLNIIRTADENWGRFMYQVVDDEGDYEIFFKVDIDGRERIFQCNHEEMQEIGITFNTFKDYVRDLKKIKKMDG